MQTTGSKMFLLRSEYDHRVSFRIVIQRKQMVNFPFKNMSTFECLAHMLISSDRQDHP